MKLSIGNTIKILRREKNITIEQLADAVGVPVETALSWEKGDTYPEITLLNPIAKYLGTDLDSLLMFETVLSQDDVMEIYKICAEKFETMDFESALKVCDGYLSQYPNSLFLKFRIGSLLQEYIQLAGSEEMANKVIDKSIDLLEAASIIDDLEVKQASLYVLSSLYTMKNEFDKAIEVLNALPKININTDFMLSTIYSITGENKKAKKVEQESLFNSVNNTIISLTSMWGSALSEKDYDFALEIASLQQNTISSYQLEPFMLGNNLLMFADIYAHQKDINMTLNYLDRFTEWILEFDKHSIDLSDNKFFNLVEDYDPIMSVEYLKQNFINSVVLNDSYDFIKYTDKYKRIVSKIL